MDTINQQEVEMSNVPITRNASGKEILGPEDVACSRCGVSAGYWCDGVKWFHKSRIRAFDAVIHAEVEAGRALAKSAVTG